MPDVLHWLGIKRIDNMISMSDMKVRPTFVCAGAFSLLT